MRKIFYVFASSIIVFGACQSSTTKEELKPQQLSEEAIIVHDEIMPQIASFDRAGIKIDSLLQNLPVIAKANKDLDTAVVKKDLMTLKSNLESATDNMMTWMKDYVSDSTDISYQQAELEKIKLMKKQFEDVSLESNKKLAPFNK